MSEVVPVALLLADRVIEEMNHKKAIIGTFTTFRAPRFPVVFPPWYIYAAATNLEPDSHSYSLTIAHRETQHVVYSGGGEFKVEDLLAVPEFVNVAPGVVFNKEGIHVVTFCIDGKEILTRLFDVKLVGSAGGE